MDSWLVTEQGRPNRRQSRSDRQLMPKVATTKVHSTIICTRTTTQYSGYGAPKVADLSAVTTGVTLTSCRFQEMNLGKLQNLKKEGSTSVKANPPPRGQDIIHTGFHSSRGGGALR